MSRTFRIRLALVGAILFAFAFVVEQANTPAPTITYTVVDYAAPSLGVVTDADAQVLFVEPSSAADAAGIRVGDRFAQIRSVAVTSGTQANEAFRKEAFFSPVALTVERNGQMLTLEAVPPAAGGTSGAPLPTFDAAATPPPTGTAVPPDQFYF